MKNKGLYVFCSVIPTYKFQLFFAYRPKNPYLYLFYFFNLPLITRAIRVILFLKGGFYVICISRHLPQRR